MDNNRELTFEQRLNVLEARTVYQASEIIKLKSRCDTQTNIISDLQSKIFVLEDTIKNQFPIKIPYEDGNGKTDELLTIPEYIHRVRRIDNEYVNSKIAGVEDTLNDHYVHLATHEHDIKVLSIHGLTTSNLIQTVNSHTEVIANLQDTVLELDDQVSNMEIKVEESKLDDIDDFDDIVEAALTEDDIVEMIETNYDLVHKRLTYLEIEAKTSKLLHEEEGDRIRNLETAAYNKLEAAYIQHVTATEPTRVLGARRAHAEEHKCKKCSKVMEPDADGMYDRYCSLACESLKFPPGETVDAYVVTPDDFQNFKDYYFEGGFSQTTALFDVTYEEFLAEWPSVRDKNPDDILYAFDTWSREHMRDHLLNKRAAKALVFPIPGLH